MTSSLRRTAVLVAATLATTSAIVASQAAAAPTWQPSAALSVIGRDAFDAQVAADTAGNATAVWTIDNGTHVVIQASTRPAGGSWSAPVDLSDASESSQVPDVGVDAAGNATAVWSRFDGAHLVIQAAGRPAGGGWSAPVDLSVNTQNAGSVQVVVDPAGTATAVWARNNGANAIIQSSRRPPGGSWTSAVDLSAAGQSAGFAHVAVDAGGRATAVWLRSNGTHTIVQAATRPTDGSWGAPENLSVAGQSAGAPDVAVTGTGNVTAAWYRSDGTFNIIQSATRPLGGTWTNPVDISSTEAGSGDVQVAVDQADNVTAAWLHVVGASTAVQTAQRSPEGTWQPPITLSNAVMPAQEPHVSVSATGIATALWTRFNGSVTVVQAAHRPPGGVWSNPKDLSGPTLGAMQIDVASDGAGDSVAVWSGNDGSTYLIRAAALDGTGPLVSAFNVPTSAVAGKPLGYTATATDTWSGVAAYAWSFGDGTTTSGASTSHTYAAAGNYPVSLTVTDSAGNSTTRVANTVVSVAVPAIGTFKLKQKTIATDEKTKLKVGLNTASTLKLVFKSKHKHVVKGKKKYVKVVLRKQLPAGLSKITIKAKVKGVGSSPTPTYSRAPPRTPQARARRRRPS